MKNGIDFSQYPAAQQMIDEADVAHEVADSLISEKHRSYDQLLLDVVSDKEVQKIRINGY
ncbi:hypothetical protein J2T17_006314 [Paenibacillus mucilaginosus]|uniref:hypothetical protein n=1 Tax=Paenibacillus mucilaginosus TaxID=61624 RepID=UPI003D1F0AFC